MAISPNQNGEGDAVIKQIFKNLMIRGSPLCWARQSLPHYIHRHAVPPRHSLFPFPTIYIYVDYVDVHKVKAKAEAACSCSAMPVVVVALGLLLLFPRGDVIVIVAPSLACRAS
eukprot:scaffold89146_cov32-Tisochrysis_lutea.AAC.3